MHIATPTSTPTPTPTPSPARAPTDLTARARIRDAAIECFAQEGFGTPFRTIAARAGVSPGLITHHFGSKGALRTECDAEVLERYRVLKTGAIANPSGHLLAQLAVPGPAAVLLVYMLRALHAGGPPARHFLESLVDQVRLVMAASVASGLVRPSRNEEARVRYLTDQSMGATLLQFLTAVDQTPDAFVESLLAGQRAAVLPILELYTEGLFAGPEMLDDYVRYLASRPPR